MGGVYQPEVAAQAIYFAAHSSRKEIYVGLPAAVAIWADKIASPLLDHQLAATGFQGQQTDEPVSPDRKDNLWHPVPGDHGAHGRFGHQARSFSPELWVSMNKGLVGFGALALAGIGAALLFRRGNSGDRSRPQSRAVSQRYAASSAGSPHTVTSPAAHARASRPASVWEQGT